LISASKTTFSHYNLKNLRPKVTKNLKNLRKKFCESVPRCTELRPVLNCSCFFVSQQSTPISFTCFLKKWTVITLIQYSKKIPVWGYFQSPLSQHFLDLCQKMDFCHQFWDQQTIFFSRKWAIEELIGSKLFFSNSSSNWNHPVSGVRVEHSNASVKVYNRAQWFYKDFFIIWPTGCLTLDPEIK